jgi:hypothetical protein
MAQHLYKDVTYRDKSTDVIAKCQLQRFGTAHVNNATLLALENLLWQIYVLGKWRSVEEQAATPSSKTLPRT